MRIATVAIVVPANGNAWGGAGETLEVSIAGFALSHMAQRLGQSNVHGAFPVPARHVRLNIIAPHQNGTGAARIDEFGAYSG